MKKLLLLLIIVLSPYVIYCQIGNNNFSNQYQIQTVDYSPWQLSNDGCFGCPSFYWKVTKTGNQFDLWFSSNSYYPNGAKSSTYVWGIQLYVNNIPMLSEPVWLLFYDPYSNILLSFQSRETNPKIFLKWDGLKIY